MDSIGSSCLDTFEEEDEDVFLVTNNLDLVPKKPLADCSFEEQAVYMEKSFVWLKSEIRELKSQDKLLMKKFRTMLGAVEGLKKFRKTVEEQQGILGDLKAIEGIELQPTLVDVSPSFADESKDHALQRKVSNYQRYKRVGFDKRHVSFH